MKISIGNLLDNLESRHHTHNTHSTHHAYSIHHTSHYTHHMQTLHTIYIIHATHTIPIAQHTMVRYRALIVSVVTQCIVNLFVKLPTHGQVINPTFTISKALYVGSSEHY
jgi:hypothetical protein